MTKLRLVDLPNLTSINKVVLQIQRYIGAICRTKKDTEGVTASAIFLFHVLVKDIGPWFCEAANDASRRRGLTEVRNATVRSAAEFDRRTEKEMMGY